MTTYRSGKEPGKTPEFVKPFLNALTQIHRADSGSTEKIEARARHCISELPGRRERSIVTASARGSIGLQADHTHYFDGFALMLPMKGAIGIAISRSEGAESRLLVEGEKEVHIFSLVESADAETPLSDTPQSDTPQSDTVRLLRHIVQGFSDRTFSSVDIALSSEIPGGLLPVFAASFSIALHRSLEKLSGTPSNDTERVSACQKAIEAFYGHPFSPAYILAANISESHTFVLVDTRTLEYVPLDVSKDDRPGWGLIGLTAESLPVLPTERFKLADSIAERLKLKQFRELETIRDLEHNEFEAAEKALPRKLRPAFRFLACENRRVQQLVTAIRRSDWQLCGTILLISHEARKQCWNATTPQHDEVVALAERFSHNGVYGATQTGESSFVLVAGQPFSIPGFLDAVRDHEYSTIEKFPQTIIL